MHARTHALTDEQPDIIMYPPISIEGGKGKGRGTCYSAAYMSQTRDQKRFTISEVAADWHELMIPWLTMRPSIARGNEQLDPRCNMQTYRRPSQPH